MCENNKYELSLPPYTKGTCHGNLVLCIPEINWKRRYYSNVELKILWWGDDNYSSAIKVLCSEKPPIITNHNLIKYKIKTNLKLFENYLINAEPIEIQIISSKTKSLIGTCFIPIPNKLLTIKSNCKSDIKCEIIENIFSPRNCILGNIKIQFKMVFFLNHRIKSSENDKNSIKKLENIIEIEKENEIPLSYEKILPNLDLPKQIFSLTSMYSQQNSTRSFNDIHPSDRNFLINYLTGEKMTKKQESQALSEICSISPPKSLIEALTLSITDRDDDFNTIPIRFFIRNINLTNIGIKNLQNFNQKLIYTFNIYFYKNKMKRILLGSSNSTNDIKKIDFHKNLIKDIWIPKKRKYLIFDVDYTISIDSLKIIHFGFIRINTNGIIENKFITKKVQIMNEENNLILGYLNIDIENVQKTDLHFIKCNRDEKNEEEKITEQKQQNSKEIITERSVKFESNRNDKVSKEIERKDEIVKVDLNGTKEDNLIQFLEGLIYIGNIDHTENREKSSYFIVLHTFWKGTECTQITNDNLFNYLELFPIICNKEFLDRTKNNFLVLELWEKQEESSEKLVGNILLPLHKFYVALQDQNSFEQLKQAKFPIISIDGWMPITTPLSNGIYGQIEIVLAIGTKEQIDSFKILRNLPKVIKIPSNSVTVETQTNGEKKNVESQTVIDCKTPRNVAVDKLNAFIESLAQLRTPKGLNVENNIKNAPQLRKTSELLDMLHIALSQTPPTASSNFTTPQTSAPESPSSPNIDLFKVVVEIENALHLPKTASRHPSIKQKGSKRGKGKNNRNINDIEPSTYVTFPAFGVSLNLLKTHEGPVYSTNIAERTCNPIWNKKFDVQLPIEYLTNSESKFELKVLSKQITDQIHCRLTPTPSEDIIIGTSKIDLSVLLSGLPTISGYYNIVDFSGRINGQLKVKIYPAQSITEFREVKNNLPNQNSNNVETSLDSAFSLFDPSDLSCSLLSRALKRKFTELEEITQRLKSRLQDVTDDDNTEVDDEFENDLNTEVEEDDDFNWPNFLNDTGSSTDRNSYEPLLNSFNEVASEEQSRRSNNNPSTSTSTTTLSSLSQDRVKLISEALRKAAIDDQKSDD